MVRLAFRSSSPHITAQGPFFVLWIPRKTRPFGEIEIIVVDDASTDQTAALVKERMAGDPRIQFYSQSVNSGPAAARNLALRHSRGEWVALLDADDEMTTDRLQQVLAAAQEGDVMLADNLLLYDLQVAGI